MGLIVSASNGWPIRDQRIWGVSSGLGCVDSTGGGVRGGQIRIGLIELVCRPFHGCGGVDHLNRCMSGGGARRSSHGCELDGLGFYDWLS